MSLIALGISHDTAPVAFRERVAFPETDLGSALGALKRLQPVREGAILSTCNRTDVYCGVEEGGEDEVLAWLASSRGIEPAELAARAYRHRAADAARHVMRVASGLDSMVVGEPQILGQLKGAYRLAREEGALGQILDQLFRQSFSVAKQIRTDTGIGTGAVSVAYAAVALARQIFGDLSERTALLVGAGETIELVARHLDGQGIGRIIIANRTVANAARLAAIHGGSAIALDALGNHLGAADIVVCSTGSPTPVIGREMAARAIAERRREPMCMIDIAVPSDIEPAVGEIEDVFVYTVDHLRDVIEAGQRTRREAAERAESMVDRQVERFVEWLGTREVGPTIRDVRGGAMRHRDEVLDKARRMVERGGTPEEALRFLAHTLTNKLLHAPTAALREAGANRRADIVEAARILYGMDRSEPDDRG